MLACMHLLKYADSVVYTCKHGTSNRVYTDGHQATGLLKHHLDLTLSFQARVNIFETNLPLSIQRSREVPSHGCWR